jgi:hypothetical protein
LGVGKVVRFPVTPAALIRWAHIVGLDRAIEILRAELDKQKPKLVALPGGKAKRCR